MIQLSFAVKYLETYASKAVEELRGCGRGQCRANKWEVRILRALLRLQLRAELFRQPTKNCGEVSRMEKPYWGRYSATYNEDSKHIFTILDKWAQLRTYYSYTGPVIRGANGGQCRGLIRIFMMMDSNPVSTAGLDYTFQVMMDSLHLKGKRSPNQMRRLVARFEINSFFHRVEDYEKLSQEI